MFMDSEEVFDEIKTRRRKRAIKVAITEGLMVFAIAALVIATTLFAVGYNVNPNNDWSIERTGLVQIQTLPTGANVMIDGNSLFGWTNLSRSMVEGEHEIAISKDGYEDWKKNISVVAGLYYRLDYARLFLKERYDEKLLDFSRKLSFSFSKDGSLLLAMPTGSSKWEVYKLDNEVLTHEVLDVSGILPNAKSDVRVLGWSGNNQRLMIYADGEYILLDLKKPEMSLNISEKFGFNLTDFRFLNDSASEIFVLESGNLRKIDVDGRKISEIFVKNVSSFSNLKSDLIYVADNDGDGKKELGMLKNGEKVGIEVDLYEEKEGSDGSLEKNKPEVLKASLGEYYGDFYVSFVSNDGNWRILRADDLSKFENKSDFEVILSSELNNFENSIVGVRGDGELIIAKNPEQMRIFDIETGKVKDIQITETTGWLNDFMLFENENGILSVMDFDKENVHIISDDVLLHGEIKISRNNKWIYYFSKEGMLSRVRIMD